MNEPTHPAGFRLDGHAAGDHDADVAAHLATCTSCHAYVEEVSAAARAFAVTDAEHGEGFLAKLAARAGASRAAVVPLRRRVARAAWFAAPLVAAAALVLFLRRGDTESPSAPVDTVETRFKGSLQLSVIRDRDGSQQKVSGDVAVRPGDRLRVEVAIDAERPIVVGMLGNDGTWVVLLAPTLLEAGTHLSERAARFDDAPTEGVILAGPPDAVETARATRTFDGLTVLTVVQER